NQRSNTGAEGSARLPFGGDTKRGPNPGGLMLRDPSASAQNAGNTGSQSIPEEWLSLHGDALFRYALMLVADEHDAEDLVQEPLLAAPQGHSRYAADASERTWLIAILRNKVIDQRRRDRVQDHQRLDEADPAVEGNFNRFGKWRRPPTPWAPNPQTLVES